MRLDGFAVIRLYVFINKVIDRTTANRITAQPHIFFPKIRHNLSLSQKNKLILHLNRAISHTVCNIMRHAVIMKRLCKT